MDSVEERFSFLDLLQLVNWADILLNCKDIRKLNLKYNSSDLIGYLRVTSLFQSSKPSFQCFDKIDFLQVIIQFLHLNVSFVEPNHDFDGTLGWYNQTHSSGLLKMMDNNQVDYIVDRVITNEMLSHPNLIIVTTDGNFKMNFLVRKQTLKFSVASFLDIFSSFIWLVMFISILFISGIISIILSRKNYLKKDFWIFNLNLIFDYLNMLMCKQSSSLLTKLTTRHFLMYFIPILSILFTNVITCENFSNLISPQQKWCSTLDCFVTSNYKFFSLYHDRAYILDLIQNSNRWQFKAIYKRLHLQKEKG